MVLSALPRSAGILALILSVLFISGCNDEPEAPQGYEINKINQVDFVREISANYLRLSEQIQVQYLRYKHTGDTNAYMVYRNQKWTPEYIDLKRKYQDSLNKSKAYVYRNQLDNLFDRFFDLQKLALHLKHSLINQDWELEQQAMKRLARDKEEVEKHPSRFL